MTKRPLLPLIFAAALLLALMNSLMVVWSHRLPAIRKLDEIRIARDPNLLLVGNSLLDHHLEEGAFARAAAGRGVQFVPLNAALGATDPPEQRLLFQYAVAKHAGIRTVVVGIFDFQLTHADDSSLTDLKGNRIVGLDGRFPVPEVAAAYGFGAKDRAELRLMRAFPMAANRASVWKFVELLRRTMAGVGMPSVATNSMGRVADFAALEASSAQVFDAEAAQFLRDPRHFNASYEAIFSQTQRAADQTIILVMPMSPSHQLEFYSRPAWGAYLRALTKLAAARGIRVIDASGWLTDQDDFVDHLHMTDVGVRRFSERLGGQLAVPVGASK